MFQLLLGLLLCVIVYISTAGITWFLCASWDISDRRWVFYALVPLIPLAVWLYRRITRTGYDDER